MMISEHIRRLFLDGGVLAYLVCGTQRALLIDTGCGVPGLKERVASCTDLPVTVWLSHGHLDHAMAAVEFEEVWMDPRDTEICIQHSAEEARRGFLMSVDGRCPEMLLPKDDPARYHALTDGQRLDLGGVHVTALSCPGHTRGSMAFLIEEDRILFTGDACNGNTFLFDAYSEPLSVYEQSIRALMRRTEGRYDRVVISHEGGDIAPDLLASMLDVIARIREGRADNVEFGFMGRPGTRAMAIDGQGNRLDGGSANLIYDPSRIERV